MAYKLTVNGDAYTVDVDAQKPLLWVLREDIGLTGTKFGCGIGQCRACTVMVNGTPLRSCLYNVSYIAGKNITTIEGLEDDLAETIQDAWVEAGASQCGFCQPGQIIAAWALLSANADPSDDEIDEGMPNLCRCGTYQRIRVAIHGAATALKEG